jgi:protein TonB
MFEQVLLPSRPGRKKWTVALALLGQLFVVGTLVAIPILFVQPLPMSDLSSILIAPPPPAPPPPPPAPAAPRATHVAPRHFDSSALVQPHVIPKTTPLIQDLPQPSTSAAEPTTGVPGGVTGGQVGGVLGGILGAVPSASPGPPPPPPPPTEAAAPPPKPTTPDILRIGGSVEAAKALNAPPPPYPVIAKTAHVQGTVHLDAVIGTDGHIEDLKVVSGNPLLVEAAMKAVKDWTYRPTYLNGKAVRVATQIDVHFELSS